jgi:hypothetical protein
MGLGQPVTRVTGRRERERIALGGFRGVECISPCIDAREGLGCGREERSTYKTNEVTL